MDEVFLRDQFENSVNPAAPKVLRSVPFPFSTSFGFRPFSPTFFLEVILNL